MYFEEEGVKNNQDMCWEIKSPPKYAPFFSLGSAQTKWLPLNSFGDTGNAATPASLNDTD